MSLRATCKKGLGGVKNKYSAQGLKLHAHHEMNGGFPQSEEPPGFGSYLPPPYLMFQVHHADHTQLELVHHADLASHHGAHLAKTPT